MKKKIVITGEKVNDVGYRPFLLAAAESFEIERFFADNTSINGKNGKQEVYALVDSSREKVTAFLEEVYSRTPENSRVEKIEDEDYEGNVMKTEGYYRYLTAMQLSKIATYGGKMLKKQDSMLEGQEKMLDKQDEHVQITKEGFESVTRELKGFKEIHEEIKELRHEVDELKGTVARIERKVAA